MIYNAITYKSNGITKQGDYVYNCYSDEDEFDKEYIYFRTMGGNKKHRLTGKQFDSRFMRLTEYATVRYIEEKGLFKKKVIYTRNFHYDELSTNNIKHLNSCIFIYLRAIEEDFGEDILLQFSSGIISILSEIENSIEICTDKEIHEIISHSEEYFKEMYATLTQLVDTAVIKEADKNQEELRKIYIENIKHEIDARVSYIKQLKEIV